MSLPVISVAQMREWEQATWATGRTEAEVIARVGQCVARHATNLTKPGQSILLLAGKGHNGDDVRAAQSHLTGRTVELLNVSSPTADFPALESALARKPALVVDGLFGIGLNRALDADWMRFINRLNEARLPVLAVDVPSGLNADNGQTFGTAVCAAMTLTVGAPKIGLLRSSAVPFVGRMEVATDVGLCAFDCKSEFRWSVASDFANWPPRRPAGGHKGNFGHLTVVAGSMGFHGAAVLAVRGAQRAQPGLVTLHTHEEVYFPVASQVQSAMVDIWNDRLPLPVNCTAVLIGPGLASRTLPAEMQLMTRKLWRDLLIPIVVDASSLDWLTLGPVPKNAVRVMTPHPGEAARLLKCPVQQIEADREWALREISRRFGNSWVVLKGQRTLVGRSEGEICVNSTGNPHLAQGGSGDVLAGFIAGLLAQPMLQENVARTLCYAVWQHGAAADELQARRGNWTIEDLVAEIGGCH